ncbi:MAG TPA: glycosyltransferase family 2 protein [Pyrinomonadaceae bacterium]|jgi:dolichol-phosphate mannosyltransferase
MMNGVSSLSHPAKLVSVVVPCYNEEQGIRETHTRLVDVLEQLQPLRFEIIYVDDGSQDQTPLILGQIQSSDKRVRVILLSRNFGHQIAVTAGMEHASGDAVVLIDADLQDPPEVILLMVERWCEGFQVAYGLRTERSGETGFKIWTAHLFYRLINRLSDTEIPLDTGDFRLMDRRVVDALLLMPERDRFLRGMVSWIGFRQVAVPYERAPRHAGTSKYPLVKMIRFATDAVLSFSFIPLRLATWLGFMTILMAIAGIIYAVLLRLYTDPSHWVRGWTSTFTAILFIGGVQLISLGIIGEYLGRIYSEVKKRPLYIVQERLGFEAEGHERRRAEVGAERAAEEIA